MRVHFVLNIATLLVSVVLVMGLRRLIGGPSMGGVALQLAGSLNTSLITYWTIVLIAHAVQYYEDGQKKALRSAELATQLSDARLNVLKAQLHPHFLFNTMHAISAFLYEEPEKAETMLAELAELLRLALESTSDQIVPLSQELDFVDRYLSIQKTRLGDRLTVDVDIEPELATAGVPSMLLQPLVENAVEHGIAKRLGPGHLRLRIQCRSGNLWMEVSDDGPGLPEPKLRPSEWRVGLRNTSERLIQLYGDDHSFELSNSPEGGLLARVVIPYTTAPGAGP